MQNYLNTIYSFIHLLRVIPLIGLTAFLENCNLLSDHLIATGSGLVSVSVHGGSRVTPILYQISFAQIFTSTLLVVDSPLSSFSTTFHLVRPSILPLSTSVAFFFGAAIMVCSFSTASCTVIGGSLHTLFLFFLAAVFFVWFSEVDNEESEGFHTLEVQAGFRLAILLFILSELMLFVAFFWALFHTALNVSAYTAGFFVAKGISSFQWFRIPLLNTILLVSSGVSLTAAHGLIGHQDSYFRELFWLAVLHTYMCYMEECVSEGFALPYADTQSNVLLNNLTYGSMHNPLMQNPPGYSGISFVGFLSDCFFSGLIFLFFQACEYVQALFTITDSVYGGVFYSLTGLHGFHVFIGALGLLFTIAHWNRVSFSTSNRSAAIWGVTVHYSFGSFSLPGIFFSFGQSIFSRVWWTHRVGFDGAAWYWHFVDVVWLLVLAFLYWWAALC